MRKRLSPLISSISAISLRIPAICLLVRYVRAGEGAAVGAAMRCLPLTWSDLALGGAFTTKRAGHPYVSSYGGWGAYSYGYSGGALVRRWFTSRPLMRSPRRMSRVGCHRPQRCPGPKRHAYVRHLHHQSFLIRIGGWRVAPTIQPGGDGS